MNIGKRDTSALSVHGTTELLLPTYIFINSPPHTAMPRRQMSLYVYFGPDTDRFFFFENMCA